MKTVLAALALLAPVILASVAYSQVEPNKPCDRSTVGRMITTSGC
jgi:hypothetical protein